MSFRPTPLTPVGKSSRSVHERSGSRRDNLRTGVLSPPPFIGLSLPRDPAYFSKGSPPWGEYFVSVAARASPALGTAVWANRMSFAAIFFP